MRRSQLSISPAFAVGLGVAWFALVCDAAIISYVFRHDDPRFSFLNEPTAMVRSDLVCTCVPIVGALLASLGLLARRSWGWSLALLMNVAVIVGTFAITGTAFWMARPYGVGGQILSPETFGIPTAALVVFLVLLAPSVRRGFR